jgi:hypothetical protein
LLAPKEHDTVFGPANLNRMYDVVKLIQKHFRGSDIAPLLHFMPVNEE